MGLCKFRNDFRNDCTWIASARHIHTKNKDLQSYGSNRLHKLLVTILYIILYEC